MVSLTRRTFLAISLGVLGATAGYLFFGRPSGGGSPEIKVEEVVGGLVVPWSISFINEHEAIVTERVGRVDLLDVSSGRMEVVGTVPVAHEGEAGLLGSAVVRLGRAMRVVLYYTYSRDGRLFNRLSTFDESLSDEQVLIDGIPGAVVHNGGRVRVGPDGRLYATTGDARVPELSQSLSSLAGKILRIAPDGSVPDDNPFPGLPIYSLGHRNPQGIDWHPVTKLLYATEHGPSGEFLQFAHDEVNLIVPGGNYGWPHVIGTGGGGKYIDPIIESGLETWAPSGCSFYSGRWNEEWRNDLLFATLRGEHLHRLTLDEDGRTVVRTEKYLSGTYGRLRDVVEGPDGSIYLLTSNRDGRGSPRPNDDRILRISWRR